jgi:hypothetical protein
MIPISLFDVAGRWATAKYNITDKTNGRLLTGKDFSDSFFKNFRNFETFKESYNLCVDMFNRLSPTHKTLFHIFVKETFNKHFDELTLAQLSDVQSWLYSRIK